MILHYTGWDLRALDVPDFAAHWMCLTLQRTSVSCCSMLSPRSYTNFCTMPDTLYNSSQPQCLNSCNDPTANTRVNTRHLSAHSMRETLTVQRQAHVRHHGTTRRERSRYSAMETVGFWDATSSILPTSARKLRRQRTVSATVSLCVHRHASFRVRTGMQASVCACIHRRHSPPPSEAAVPVSGCAQSELHDTLPVHALYTATQSYLSPSNGWHASCSAVWNAGFLRVAERPSFGVLKGLSELLQQRHHDLARSTHSKESRKGNDGSSLVTRLDLLFRTTSCARR
jgi:hypothetical protein